MTYWVDRILNSNAGRANPIAARELIEKAGGSVSAAKGFFPTQSSPTAPLPAGQDSINE